MLAKPIKKKKDKDAGPSAKKPLLPTSKVLSRQLSHVILTQPKIKHKRQSSYAPTNNQSTCQKVSVALEPTNRKLLQSSSKKMSTKSKKNVKSPRIKKFESYLLYIDTQFSLFSEHAKSKASDYSTDVRRDVDVEEEKDDIIELIKKYKRDYVVSQSKMSHYEKEQFSREDRAAENIKNRWRLYRTRKLINKFIKINRVKQRHDNIPSNMSELLRGESEGGMQSILSVETIKSQFEGTLPRPPVKEGREEGGEREKRGSGILNMDCIENIRISEIEGIMIKQKESIKAKHDKEMEELDKQFRNNSITRFQYEKGVKNANIFVGLRYAEINESILNARKLVSQTDGFLHELESHHVVNHSPLRSQSQHHISTLQQLSPHSNHSRPNPLPQDSSSIQKLPLHVPLPQPNKSDNRQKIIQDIVNEMIYQFCKETQRYPYLQKIMVETFADWKIGVEHNQDAIDLFCQNIIQYALSSNPLPFQNLKVPLGCSVQQLLKLHHTDGYEPDKEEDVIGDVIFKDFSKLMVFPLKSKNSPKQLSIIKLIEILNQYHNRAIFQALNQALDYERVHGIVGKPLPWKPAPNFKKLHIYQSLSSAVDKVMSYQQWRLGFHPQNFFSIRPDLSIRNLSMFRDQKLNRLMEVQQKQLEIYWQNDQMEETFLLLDIANLVVESILEEVSKDFKAILNRK